LVPKPKNDKSRFLARAGFTLSNPSALDLAIRLLAAGVDAVEEQTDVYGTYYTVAGKLVGPNGTALRVV
jgi:hypothetical protein